MGVIKMKTFAIGDIHGADKAIRIKQCLQSVIYFCGLSGPRLLT